MAPTSQKVCPALRTTATLCSLTLHVVGLERVADVQHGRAQQHVRLERLVAPHAEHQLAEGGHDPAGGDGGKREMEHGIRPQDIFGVAYFIYLFIF